MSPRRVVVSGLGVVSAIGRDRNEFWSSLVAGRSGIRPITLVDTDGLRFRNGAEVPELPPGEAEETGSPSALDRFTVFQIWAAREALEDAGLTGEPMPERSAVVTGSALGGQMTQDAQYRSLYREGHKRLPPFVIPRVMASSGASQVSMELGIVGPGLTVSTACSSSMHAIGIAFWMVRQGTADLALAGGSEAPFSWAHLKAWEALRVVSPDTCRPFSKDRKGMILGEGGAALVLEPLERVHARGGPIHAELVGFGMSSDAHHLTQPSPAGAVRAMREALADGRVQGDEVDYVNAHGTGTLTNDPSEARAIHEVFGARTHQVAVSSTKSMHGHTLGAAGAIEAAATVLALREGVIPPTVHFTEPDPECDLDVVPNRSRRKEMGAALSSSFAFGGLNAVLAFRRWPTT